MLLLHSRCLEPPTKLACLLAPPWLSAALHIHHRYTDRSHNQQHHNTPQHPPLVTRNTTHPHLAARPQKPTKNVLLPLQPPHDNHRPLQLPPPHPPQQRRRRRHRRRLAHLPRPARLLHRESPPLPSLAPSRPQRPPRPAIPSPARPGPRPGILHQRRRPQSVPSGWKQQQQRQLERPLGSSRRSVCSARRPAESASRTTSCARGREAGVGEQSGRAFCGEAAAQSTRGQSTLR